MQTETFPLSVEDEQTMFNKWLTAVVIAVPLTFLASLVWSGLVLLGFAVLALAFGLISAALISVRLYQTPTWGTVMLGQVVALIGIVILLLAAL